MTNAARDFPQLRQALRKAVAAAAAARAALRPQTDEDTVQDKAAHRAWSHAKQSYADAMLEPILGCPWDWTFPVSQATGRAYPRTVGDIPLVTLFPRLLNRPLVFVRRSAPAPLGPSSCAFVAELDAFDDDGCVKPWVLQEAAALAEHGYGIWVRPDLTQWQEAHLSLLVAAGGLRAARAQAFGFIALADAAS